MSKRQYSEKEVGAALAYLDFVGNAKAAAKTLKIPYTTLIEWDRGRRVNESVTEIRNEKKEEISALIEQAVREMVGASAGKLSTANFQQLWTGVGIAVDKMQLLKGEATQITKDAGARTNEERAARILDIVKPGAAKEAA